jgi:hypothetical protein
MPSSAKKDLDFRPESPLAVLETLVLPLDKEFPPIEDPPAEPLEL